MFDQGHDQRIVSARLQRVLDDWLAPFDGFYIYYPCREQMAPKLRAFIDLLREPAAPMRRPARARSQKA